MQGVVSDPFQKAKGGVDRVFLLRRVAVRIESMGVDVRSEPGILAHGPLSLVLFYFGAS